MLNNYFKLAWRNLLKHPGMLAIHVVGLSTGIAFVLLIAVFIYSELQVNNNFTNSDRICLVQSKWKDPNMGYDFTTLAPLAKALKENYPGLVEDFYHHDGITSIVSKGDKKFSEGFQVGDASLLKMFDFPLLYGNAATALQTPNALAITEAMARKYFGKTDVLGETLTIQSFSGSKQDFEITAVLKNPVFNTVTNWGNGINKGENQFFLPASSLKFFGRDAGFEAWQNSFIISYVQLKQGVRPADLQQAVQQLLKLNVSPDVQKNLTVYFTPVKDYYLQSNNKLALTMIYSLATVGLFILLMALVNFINLSIGGATARLKEIGVRKVMGSSRSQLIYQFLTESILLVAFSVLLALIIYSFASPFAAGVLGKQLPGLTDFSALFLLVPLGLIVLIGLAAGFYPALVLSRQQSVDSLKGKLRSVKDKLVFRHSLVGLQFVAVIVVFVAAIVIDQQVGFFLGKNLGYQKEMVITAKLPRDWTPQGVRQMEVKRAAFAELPQVASAAVSFEIPDGASSSMNNVMYPAAKDSSHGVIAVSLFTDEHYAATYHIPVAAGKFFNEQAGMPDSASIVINESAARALGYKQPHDAIGELVKFQGSQQALTIGGVVKDFHFGTLHEPIRPLYFVHLQNAPLFRYMSFKIKPGNTTAAINGIQRQWSALMPDAPFVYSFMDDTLARLYQTEVQMKKAASAATIIAVLLVLMGVLGLVTQSLARRTKEVGIRKVLGASVLQVMGVFVKEFAGIIIVANCIAWPLAYYGLHKWLINFAYRIELNLLPFAIAGTLLMLMVILLIAAKTANTALKNPVVSLRSE